MKKNTTNAEEIIERLIISFDTEAREKQFLLIDRQKIFSPFSFFDGFLFNLT